MKNDMIVRKPKAKKYHHRLNNIVYISLNSKSMYTCYSSQNTACE